MVEDEIEFLGARPRALHPSVNSVTGFTLHIEKNGNEPGLRMMFRKVNTNTVVVGRKPPNHGSGGIYDSDNAKAMFRCPVVSRAHAKFTFSDSGLLYLTDTSSHHGTHIRQPSHLTSNMIPTQIPVQVHNGDVITFGKSVGRNNEIVRPIVARAELIYHTPTPRTPTSIIRPTSSGRYGLGSTSPDDNSPSESSSEDNADDDIASPSSQSDHSSDHDSDIVEIPSFPKRIRSMIIPASRPLFDSPAPASDSLSIVANDGNDESDLATTIGDRRARLLADARCELESDMFTRRANLLRNYRTRYPSDSLQQGKRSKSKSTSPMELATPSPSPSPAKILLNETSSETSKDGNGNENEGSQNISPLLPTFFAFDMPTPGPVQSPLDSPPPLPSSSQPASNGEGSFEVIPFAGHAQEEDAASALAHFLPSNESFPGPDVVVEDEIEVEEQQEQADPEAESMKPLDCNAAVDEDERMMMDEQVFDEIHHGSPAPAGVKDANELPSLLDFDDTTMDAAAPGAEASSSSSDISVAASKSISPSGVNGMSKFVDLRAALFSLKERLGTSLTTSAAPGSASGSSAAAPGGGANAEVFEAHEAQLKEIDEKLSAMTTNITALQLQNRKYKSRFNSNVTTMNSKLSQLTTLGTITSDISAAQSNLTSAKGDIDWMKTDVRDLRTDVEVVRSDVDVVRSELDAVRNDIDGVRSDIDEVRNDNEGIRMEVDGARNDIDFIRGDVDAARNDVDAVRDDCEGIQGNVSGLQADIGGVRIDVDGLRVEFDDVRRDVDDLMGGEGVKKEVWELKEDFDKLQQDWKDWKEHAVSNLSPISTREELNVMDEGIKALSSQVEEANRRIGIQEEGLKAFQARDEETETGKNAHANELAGTIEALRKIQEKSTTELQAAEAARVQAENELRAIVAVRKDVEAQLLAAQAAFESFSYPTTAQSSLKRKRADDSEEFGASDCVIMDVDESVDVGSRSNSFVDSTDNDASTMVPNADGILVPSPKRARRTARARRAGTIAVQTVTAISIGAVAAWTALAFS